MWWAQSAPLTLVELGLTDVSKTWEGGGPGAAIPPCPFSLYGPAEGGISVPFHFGDSIKDVELLRNCRKTKHFRLFMSTYLKK